MRNIKKFLSLLLVFAMLCGMLVMPAAAASNGTFTSGVTWALDDNGVLTISGNGPMDDGEVYTSGNTLWGGQTISDSITKAIIGDGVTSIGKFAFDGCSKLTSVNIPYGVTEITEAAFRDCSALTEVTIPASVTKIDVNAFRRSGLTSVNIPDGLKEIGISAFNKCLSLTSVTIPASVTAIGASAFANCTALETITFAGTTEQWNSIAAAGTVPDGVNVVCTGAGTGSETDTYSITVAGDIGNGTVTTDVVEAAEGDPVTVTATPADGYELESLTVTGADNVTVTVTDSKFIMPASNVTVSATFKMVEEEPTTSALTFTVGTAVAGPGAKVELPITITGSIPTNTASIEFAGTYCHKRGNALAFVTENCSTTQNATFAVTPTPPPVGSQADIQAWTAILTVKGGESLTSGELGKLAFRVSSSMSFLADEEQLTVGLTSVVFKDAAGEKIATSNTYENGYVKIDLDLTYTITCGEAEHGSITSVTVAGVESNTFKPVESPIIVITTKADEGYGYKGLIVTDTDTEEVLYQTDGWDRFNSGSALSNPYANITITPVFSKLHDITVGETANGTVTVAETAMEGSSVKVTATPASDYKPVAITVKKADGSTVDVTTSSSTSNGVTTMTGSFTMPGEAVTVIATFEELVTYSVELTCTEGGSAVLAFENTAEEGALVRVKQISVGEGYELESIKVNNVALDLTGLKTSPAPAVGTYIDFTMPAENITIVVTFKEAVVPVSTNLTGATYVDGTLTANVEVTWDKELSFTSISGYFDVYVDETALGAPTSMSFTNAASEDEGSITWLNSNSAYVTISSSFTDAPAKFTLVWENLTLTEGDHTLSLQRGEGEVWYTVTNSGVTSYYKNPGEGTKTFRAAAVKTYGIDVADTVNGTVNVSHTAAVAGGEVTVTATPDTNYELATITVTTTSGKSVDVVSRAFTMPAENVTVTVTFKEKVDKPFAIHLTDAEYADGVLTVKVSMDRPLSANRALGRFFVTVDGRSIDVATKGADGVWSGGPDTMAMTNGTSSSDGSAMYMVSNNGHVQIDLKPGFNGTTGEYTLTYNLELTDGNYTVAIMQSPLGWGALMDDEIGTNSQDVTSNAATDLSQTVTVGAGGTEDDGGEEGDGTATNITSTDLTNGVYTITEGGTYQLAPSLFGTIKVETTEAVTIVGNGAKWSSDYTMTSAPHYGLFIDCTKQAGVNLTLQDVYISNSNSITCTDGSGCGVVGVTGTGNTLNFEGVNVVEYAIGGGSNPAAIHVKQGDALTIGGNGTLYFYKSAQGAGFGGTSGELNGDITFKIANMFAKGTKQGALIGAGSGSGSVTTAPGSVTFESGTYNLISNSRGAVIGGSAGSGGASSGTTVYIKTNANVNINVDWSGAAVGGGGYAEGNDASGGTLYVEGGSLRTYVDTNAANNANTGYNGAPFTAGINDAAITAARKNNTTDNETVYKCVFDTSMLKTAASNFTVKVDGVTYYVGGLHEYGYVQEGLDKELGEQLAISSTPSNWYKNNDTNLYFYLTGKNHEIEVNGEKFTATYDASTIESKAVYTTGAFTVSEGAANVEIEIGNGTATGTTDENGVTEFKAGTADGAPTITVTAPTGGWVEGSNTFTVASTNDVACVVLVKDANGNYTKVNATTTGSTHSFTATLAEGDSIVVAVKGDVSGDGVVTSRDAMMLNSIASGTLAASNLQSEVGHISAAETITSRDAMMANAVAAGNTSLSW